MLVSLSLKHLKTDMDIDPFARKNVAMFMFLIKGNETTKGN